MVSALTGEDWDVKDREGLIDWIETKGGEVTDEGQYNLYVRMPPVFLGELSQHDDGREINRPAKLRPAESW